MTRGIVLKGRTAGFSTSFAFETRMRAQLLALLPGLPPEEHEARVARLCRHWDYVEEAELEVGPRGHVVDCCPSEDGTIEISVVNAIHGAPSAEKAQVDAQGELRSAIARQELGKVFGRPSLTVLPELIERGIYKPSVAWEALNQARYDELERQKKMRERHGLG